MLPAQRPIQRALLSRMLSGQERLATALFASLLLASPALAQDDARDGPRSAAPPAADEADSPGDSTPPAEDAPQDAGGPVAFEADRVEYADRTDTITATGNVLLRRGDQSARADAVAWNRETGQIVATGSVRIVDENGNQIFSERVELTDELKTGAMDNLLLVMRERGRLAALAGKRGADGRIVLERAAYSACEVVDSRGCPKNPSWRVTAARVVYDPERKRVRFSGARLEIFGVPLIPLPGLSVRTDGGAVSGFLVPDLASSPSNGLQIGESYYWRLAENRDMTASVYAYTKAAPMVGGQYRALTGSGAYQITGYATGSRRIPITGSNPDPNSQRDFRGYIEANGRFQLSPHWSTTFSLRRTTDATFLRRYDISRDDRLRSMVAVERIDADSYLSIAGWETQTLRVGDRPGLVPLALPEIDYRRRLADPLLGGKIELQANSLAITRTSGQDTQRAFASARWDLRRITGMGQEVSVTALARGDIYHSDENDLTATAIYRGKPGWQGRTVAMAALDIRWPLVGALLGGTQVLTPRLQIVAAPQIRNLAIPNEDARAIDLEDSNLFALNRFPGYDRIEDGTRFTYGFDWRFERPRWQFSATVGQSYRLSNEPTLLPPGTGLSSRTSDIVGRIDVRYRDFVKFTHRFRLDKDNMAVRRAEIDATIGSHRTYAEIGYVRLNRDITQIEDLQDREELRAAGRVGFARYWSIFGSGVFNLTDRREDPRNRSDGFQPLRTRLGVAYEDDCLEMALTWRRDYQRTGDARKGNIFQVHLALRNIGFR